MTDFAVELRQVNKVFTSGRGAATEAVAAVKDMNLGIPPGTFFTLLGPSGCGKTTTLRLIAGFEVPTTGEVYIQGRPMSKVPPNRRPVNTVFQNYALFPHLDVAQNVAFGLVVKRVPGPERDRLVREALEMVRLPAAGSRKPSQLSGGQQQRIALARALVNRPAVLLLDEPLGALDLKLRKAMQLELKQIQKRVGITFVYVTHDQEEALTMSDIIAVMSNGVIQQMGGPLTLYKKPANRFVADFIGESNFIQGTVETLAGSQATLAVGGERVIVDKGEARLSPGKPATFIIRPEKIVLSNPDQAPPGALSAVVQEIVYIGTDTRYLVALPSGETAVVRVQNGCQIETGQYAQGDRLKVHWLPEDARTLSD
jgi:spermidine/putrescine transport system ATP-binding protein